jgi:hypothetical protein
VTEGEREDVAAAARERRARAAARLGQQGAAVGRIRSRGTQLNGPNGH